MARVRLALGALAALALLSGFEWEAPLGRLLREAEAPEPSVRALAVRRLAELPSHEVEAAVLDALDDEVLEVRVEAARAAARLRLSAAAPRLLGWIDDPDDDLRAEAALALGTLGGEGVLEVLGRALSDARASVRAAALEGLLTLGDPRGATVTARALDDADASVRALAARALGAFGGADAEPALAAHAADDAPEVRAAVLGALGRSAGAEAAPLLIAALDDDVAEVRLAAIAGLGEVRAEVALPALEPLARASDPRVARTAVAALAALESEAALDVVVEAALGDAARATAETALRARARRAPDATARALARRLGGDETSAARAAEVLALVSGSASIEAAVPALLEARAARRGGVAVLRALGASGARDALLPLLVALAGEAADERSAAADALAGHFDTAGPDGRAVEPLLEALSRAPEAEVRALVELLGRTGASRAAPALVALAGAGDATLVARVARALGEMDADDARATLARLVEHDDASVRAEAARALGRTGGARELPGLLGLLDAHAPTDRHAVIEALGAIGARLARVGADAPGLVERLAERARDEDPRLGDAAVFALGRLADPSACATLRSLFDAAPISRARAALRALGLCDDDASRAVLREQLDSTSPDLGAVAAGVLGERGDATDAARLLHALLRLAWPASAAATFSLARLARRGLLDAGAADAVCVLGSSSHDPIVRANVAVALAAVGRRCADGPHPEAWLERPRSGLVRGAAARWAWATRASAPLPGVAEAALRACASDLGSSAVARACTAPELGALTTTADVVAYAPDGHTLLAERWVALALADGSVLLGRTDANARIVVQDVPEGPLSLDVPENLPLEP